MAPPYVLKKRISIFHYRTSGAPKSTSRQPLSKTIFWGSDGTAGDISTRNASASSRKQHHNHNNARPRYGPNAPARRPADAPIVRLPSYKELTAALRCDDVHGPPTPTAHGVRSSLLTHGVIHLPPLNVPVPVSASASASGPSTHASVSVSASASSSSSSSPSSTSNLTKLLNGNACKHPAPSYTYKEHEASEDKPPETKRYLDLSVHCPLPSQRVPSPYVDSQSMDPAGSRGVGQCGGYSPQHNHNTRYASVGRPGPDKDTGGATRKATRTRRRACLLRPNPPIPRLKFSGRQPLSCYFCRRRKIACGRSQGKVGGGQGQGQGQESEACNQCVLRNLECHYPIVSFRGEHNRITSAARKGLSVSSGGVSASGG
ncbi:hypothetical protein B0H13DRAFT_2279544 [Mycena leptocephala]|nr:hypothetical protein B0H13DRAFT_2279544 [Mycena leptocephala]